MAPSYITAAFRSVHENEAYIFFKNKYVVDNYCPGEKDDKILKGPLKISEGLPSLKGTIFANQGIDCAFASRDRDGQAFIFSSGSCALFDYGPFTNVDKIIQGPMPIAQMFPYLKGTVFETGVDAAFESSKKHEAYLFKEDQYARISYCGPNPCLINQGSISKSWPCLRGTIFESNIGAAFASHRLNQAYLFKDEYYALIQFTPGDTNDTLPYGVQEIEKSWPNLANVDLGLVAN